MGGRFVVGDLRLIDRHRRFRYGRAVISAHGDELRHFALSLAKTPSELLRGVPRSFNLSTGPRPRAWFEARATAILRPSALHGHTGVAVEAGERAGWAAALDL